jgi:hypothetical protein
VVRENILVRGERVWLMLRVVLLRHGVCLFAENLSDNHEGVSGYVVIPLWLARVGWATGEVR